MGSPSPAASKNLVTGAAVFLAVGGMVQAALALKAAVMGAAGAAALYLLLVVILGLGHASSNQANSAGSDAAGTVGGALVGLGLALQGAPVVLMLAASLLVALRRSWTACFLLSLVALIWYPIGAYALDLAAHSKPGDDDFAFFGFPWGTVFAVPAAGLLLSSRARLVFAEARQSRLAQRAVGG